MDSSNSFELSLTQFGRRVAFARLDQGRTVARTSADAVIDGPNVFEIRFVRSGELSRSIDVSLGASIVMTVPPGVSDAVVRVEDLDREFGESSVKCSIGSSDDDPPVVIMELCFVVKAEQKIIEFHSAIVSDLEQIHGALALDVLARTTQRRGRLGQAQTVVPDDEVDRVLGLCRRLEVALEQIGRQPSSAMIRSPTVRKWRPGLRIRASDVVRAARDPGFVISGCEVKAIGCAPIETTYLTTDIAEHRHIRSGIERIVARCRGLAIWCERAAREHDRERTRWSDDGSADSIYGREIAPRVAVLLSIAGRATGLGHRAARMRSAHHFISSVSPARTRIEPTPIFLGRVGYREAYQVLREIEKGSLLSLVGEDVRLRFKSLSRLYEYWCFIRIVTELGRLIGPPVLPESIRVVDDVYRPDLEPGQTFSFRDAHGTRVFVTYEPDVVPLHAMRRNPITIPTTLGQSNLTVRRPSLGWIAALASEPLRPDVLIEVSAPGSPTVALVLDAKNRRHFRRDHLWEPTDYRTRIFDPGDGRQPIRQVYFLHPNESSPPFDNLPGYLSGRSGNLDNSIIGAVPFTPKVADHGVRVLMRFLELSGVRLSQADPGDMERHG